MLRSMVFCFALVLACAFGGAYPPQPPAIVQPRPVIAQQQPAPRGLEAELTVPATAEPYSLVLITLRTNAKAVAVKVIGRGGFRPIECRELYPQPGVRSWVFTGPPDQYAGWVDCFGEEQIRSLAFTVTIGPQPGPEPTPPNPTPPGPEPTPPAPDTDIAKLAYDEAMKIPSEVRRLAAATAKIYSSAANGLEDGTHASLDAAAEWIRDERTTLWKDAAAAPWNGWLDTLAAQWSARWPMTRRQVIDFYRSVATGLQRVR